MVKTALAQLAQWAATGQDMAIAVNVSAPLLGDRKFITDIIALVRAAPVDPGRLTFEITESTALAKPVTAIPAMQLLRDVGLRISIDDYGTAIDSVLSQAVSDP